MSQENKSKSEISDASYTFEIVVNGRQKIWKQPQISFEQLVVLAFEHYVKNLVTIYTATYERGDDRMPRGSLTVGETIPVKNHMVFNITSTSKS